MAPSLRAGEARGLLLRAFMTLGSAFNVNVDANTSVGDLLQNTPEARSYLGRGVRAEWKAVAKQTEKTLTELMALEALLATLPAAAQPIPVVAPAVPREPPPPFRCHQRVGQSQLHAHNRRGSAAPQRWPLPICLWSQSSARIPGRMTAGRLSINWITQGFGHPRWGWPSGKALANSIRTQQSFCPGSFSIGVTCY